jgi:uncharacterized protein (TIGR02246 family)
MRRMTTDTPDPEARAEELVRGVEDAYDRAWCAGDLEALLACFDPAAVLVNPRGQVAVGLDDIRAALGGFLGGEARGSEHRSTLERVTFVRDDVAVVDGRAVVSIPGTGAPLVHRFTDVLVTDGTGRWVIAAVRAYGLEGAGELGSAEAEEPERKGDQAGGE